MIFFSASFISLISACGNQSVRDSHNHHQTGYVSWGIDEFELFGLTKEELSKKFKGLLHISEIGAAVAFDDGRSGHFHLEFDKDAKVNSVQRVFIDGAGCEIFGPFLASKRQALEFTINGLKDVPHLDKDDSAKLAIARKLIANE